MNIQMLGLTEEEIANLKNHLADLKTPGKFTNEQLLAWVNGPEFGAIKDQAWDAGMGQEYADFQREVQVHSLGLPATVEESNTLQASLKPKMPYGLIAAGVAAYFFLK